MEKLKKKNLFFCQLLLLIILSFSLIIPNSIVCVKAETIDEQTTISVQEIIENTTFVTFRKGDETSQYGRNMFACFYVPNSVYESSYTYGLVLFPKNYGEKLGINSDYLKKAEEQNIYIANIPAPASLAAENGRLFKFGIINILEQNIDRTFSFIFYAQDTEGNIAYAKPQFAAWATLDAEEYTDAQVIAMIEGRVAMETSFGTIVEKCKPVILTCQVQHVDIPMPDRLIRMSDRCNYQMVRKYRIWIYKNVIFLALSPFKPDHALLWRTVFPTKETLAHRYVFLIQLCSGRNDPGRIELKLYCQSASLNFPYPDILQGPEVITRKRPA